MSLDGLLTTVVRSFGLHSYGLYKPSSLDGSLTTVVDASSSPMSPPDALQCRDMRLDMRIDMCVDMCVGICVGQTMLDMCRNMCMDRCMGVCRVDLWNGTVCMCGNMTMGISRHVHDHMDMRMDVRMACAWTWTYA